MSEKPVHVQAKDVKKLFGYDAGLLHWLERPTLGKSWNTKHAGKVAGSITHLGYRVILIDRRPYKAHRLVWAFFHGEWPDGYIDHINGDPSDNHISNLRVVSAQDNGRNMRRSRANSSGITGVHYRRHIRKWVARIFVNGRDTHLGVFDTAADAAAARQAAQATHGFHSNHGSAR